jgi:hypothetical protein
MKTLRNGDLETWTCCRDTDRETGRRGHGDTDMETWTWRHGHGDMAWRLGMETWTLRHGPGDMDMETWNFKKPNRNGN